MPVIGLNNLPNSAKFEAARIRNPSAKRALCFGDSWFQYPPKPADLNKQLAAHFRDTLFLNEGLAGRDSAQWKSALPRVREAIKEFKFHAILLSHGGNDVVGDELFEFVKTKEQAQSAGTTLWTDVPAEVAHHIRLETFELALRYAINDYKEVVQYRDMYSPQSIIFAHTYDNIYPSGKPFKLGPIKLGPWVKPAFDQVGLTNPDKQRVVTNWLLEQFRRVLHGFVSIHPNMHLVDSLNTLTSKNQWDNEIHPTKSGFAAIAKKKWIPILSSILR